MSANESGNINKALKCQSTAKEFLDQGRFATAVKAYGLEIEAWGRCKHSPEIFQRIQIAKRMQADAQRKADGAASPPPPAGGSAVLHFPPHQPQHELPVYYPPPSAQPPPLPYGWITQFDASSRPYYVNTYTQQSQYEHPAFQPPPAAGRMSPPPPVSVHVDIHPPYQSHGGYPPPVANHPQYHPHGAPPAHAYVPAHGFASAPPMDAAAAVSPPDHLTDQVFSCNLFVDPVIADDGFTYERASIEAHWRRSPGISPKTNARLPSQKLVPNHDKKSQVLEWRASNPSYRG